MLWNKLGSGIMNKKDDEENAINYIFIIMNRVMNTNYRFIIVNHF